VLIRVLCLLLALVSIARAAEENPLGMSYVETKDLKLIYFDPVGYLASHAIRTFTNSLAWQRRMFGWVPSEPTTILLKDLADYGNASAGAAPHNRLVFDIAPQSHAFETYPASERMFSLMNHEMVHMVQGDIASSREQRWRRFFHGKVQPQAANPETLIYNYLTTPRFSAPRWYIEGSAVFMETWMNGGVGRAQGGYDEMVFRAMVKDNAYFYDPLGLVSRGTKVDFQAAPMRTSTAPVFLLISRTSTRRRRSSNGFGATRVASVTIPTSSSGCSACRWNELGRTGLRSSEISSRRTSWRCANSRSPSIARWARALSGPSPGCTTTKRAARSTAPLGSRASSSTSARSTRVTAVSASSPTSSGQCSTESRRSHTTR
jgi:hypothetical protein